MMPQGARRFLTIENSVVRACMSLSCLLPISTCRSWAHFEPWGILPRGIFKHGGKCSKVNTFVVFDKHTTVLHSGWSGKCHCLAFFCMALSRRFWGQTWGRHLCLRKAARIPIAERGHFCYCACTWDSHGVAKGPSKVPRSFFPACEHFHWNL